MVFLIERGYVAAVELESLAPRRWHLVNDIHITSTEIENRAKFLVELLEKAVSVNSFFITAGYGTFFGLWAILKDDLPRGYAAGAGLLLLISAALFVFWH